MCLRTTRRNAVLTDNARDMTTDCHVVPVTRQLMRRAQPRHLINHAFSPGNRRKLPVILAARLGRIDAWTALSLSRRPRITRRSRPGRHVVTTGRWRALGLTGLFGRRLGPLTGRTLVGRNRLLLRTLAQLNPQRQRAE